MPLKSRTTENRAARAADAANTANDNVQPRGREKVTVTDPPANTAAAPAETTGAAAQATQEALSAPTPALKAPRKPRAAKAPVGAMEASQGVAFDKKAARSRLTEIEKAVKKSYTDERVKTREVANEFAASRSLLENEHRLLSTKLSAAAFGKA